MIELEMGAAKPETFTIYVRIPEWAGPKTLLSVNGKRTEGDPIRAEFFALARTWKEGDRIEFEIEMRLEAVDDANRNTLALMRGPLALFAIGNTFPNVTRDQFLGATLSAQSSDDWTVHATGGPMTVRTFAAIQNEPYRLYHRVAT